MLRNCSSRTLRQAGAVAFSLLLGGMTLPAQAISVDTMVVWSASNQPLRMDIELVDLQGADLRDVRLEVASAAEHERMGLTRPEWANNARFKVIALSSGKVIARATTDAAMDAEFVNFLVSIRGSGLAQLQQVASKISANGAEPLASPQAEPVAARTARREAAPVAEAAIAAAPVPSAAAFADKPYVKPVVVAPKPAAAPAPAAVSAPAPAPVPATPAPASAELVAAAEADNADILAEVGTEPTLESLQAERAQLLQQVTDSQTRLTELDQQIAALNPEAMPATETPTALAEAETSPAEPVEGKLLGYTYFSNVMLVMLAAFMTGMIALDRMRARLS